MDLVVDRVGSWVLWIGVKSNEKEDGFVTDFEILDSFFDLDFILCIKSWKIGEIDCILSIKNFKDVD